MSRLRWAALLGGVILVSACAMTPERPPIQETRTLDSIRMTFDRNRGDLYAIYHEHLDKKPQLTGKIMLQLVISPDGYVVQSEIVQSTVGDDQFASAIRNVASSFDFGPVRQPGNMAITYPIEFFPMSLPMPTNPRATRW